MIIITFTGGFLQSWLGWKPVGPFASQEAATAYLEAAGYRQSAYADSWRLEAGVDSLNVPDTAHVTALKPPPSLAW